jgi:hypothetical protein
MSNYLDDYVSVQDRLKEFINAFPDYRIKTHVLEESLTPNCDVYIVKCELYRTEADAAAWTTGLSSESKSKQYALELAETGSLGRALNLAGYFAKPSPSPKRPSLNSPNLSKRQDQTTLNRLSGMLRLSQKNSVRK